MQSPLAGSGCDYDDRVGIVNEFQCCFAIHYFVLLRFFGEARLSVMANILVSATLIPSIAQEAAADVIIELFVSFSTRATSSFSKPTSFPSSLAVRVSSATRPLEMARFLSLSFRKDFILGTPLLYIVVWIFSVQVLQLETYFDESGNRSSVCSAWAFAFFFVSR